jgi:hypothetical protein
MDEIVPCDHGCVRPEPNWPVRRCFGAVSDHYSTSLNSHQSPSSNPSEVTWPIVVRVQGAWTICEVPPIMDTMLQSVKTKNVASNLLSPEHCQISNSAL